MQPLAGQHHAGPGQLLVVGAHRREKLLVGHHPGFRVGGGLDYHHESHQSHSFGLFETAVVPAHSRSTGRTIDRRLKFLVGISALSGIRRGGKLSL
ncbi:hypothetical protein D3C84_1008220 [compost metagenome]